MDSLAEVGAFFGFGVTEDASRIVTEDGTLGVTPEFQITLLPDIIGAKREGRPMFLELETVIMHVAGDAFNQISKPVDEDVKRKFATQYQAWKINRDANLTIAGTPLKEWPAIGPAQVAELNALHVYNVEGLADIADTHLNRSPTLRELRTKAKAWLAQAKGGAEVIRLASEAEEAKAKIAAQDQELGDLKRQMAELLAAQKRDEQRQRR